MTDAEQIAFLKQMLIEQWGVYVASYIEGNDKGQQERAFYAFDRKLRKAGILPTVKETT